MIDVPTCNSGLNCPCARSGSGVPVSPAAQASKITNPSLLTSLSSAAAQPRGVASTSANSGQRDAEAEFRRRVHTSGIGKSTRDGKRNVDAFGAVSEADARACGAVGVEVIAPVGVGGPSVVDLIAAVEAPLFEAGVAVFGWLRRGEEVVGAESEAFGLPADTGLRERELNVGVEERAGDRLKTVADGKPPGEEPFGTVAFEARAFAEAEIAGQVGDAAESDIEDPSIGIAALP